MEQENLSFGQAIAIAKQRQKKIARKGWNGNGVWVIYNPGSSGEIQEMTPGSIYQKHGVFCTEILPCFDMYTINANGRRAMLPGWSADKEDIISEDWYIVK